MKIVDLARAIAPECAHKIIGIRPGEKIHEALISEDEGRNAIEYDECYILKQTPSTEDEMNGGRRCPENFQYSSDKNPEIISIENLRIVLENIADDYSIEQSRWAMQDIS
jgi:UDP-N-acetylglucosamine 4,6-dehydratase